MNLVRNYGVDICGIQVILSLLYQKTQKNKLDAISKTKKESEVKAVEKAYKYRIYPK